MQNPKDFIGQHKSALDTPCLVIDKKRLVENIINMQDFAQQQNKLVRPHTKTHKCSHICQLQIEHGAIGISAAKLGEAEVLVEKHIPGILITSPLVTALKIKRLAACLAKAKDIMLVLDNKDNALALNAMAKNVGQPLNVLVDLDPGVHRTGVAYDDALAFGQWLHKQSHLNLCGIQCYAGNLQHIANYAERKKASQQAMQKAAQTLSQFNSAGLPCDILTGTGTGTYDIDSEVAAVTEIQPGSYTVMDAEYRNIGSAQSLTNFTQFKNSLTLLTSVLSINHSSHVTVDAGLKALYFDAATKPIIVKPTNLQYDWGGFGDEHGKITGDLTTLQLGSIVEMIVPHCDPTINLFDAFWITENDIVVDSWPIDMRGKCQ